MNKYRFIGNVTRDAEARVTPNGLDVCSFTVAVNDKHDKKKPAIFVKVTAWRQSATTCAKYVKQGMKIYCEGKLKDPQQCMYTDKNGNTRVNLEIDLEDYEFLSSGNGQQSESRSQSAPQTQQSYEQPMSGGFTAVETDELPF